MLDRVKKIYKKEREELDKVDRKHCDNYLGLFASAGWTCSGEVVARLDASESFPGGWSRPARESRPKQFPAKPMLLAAGHGWRSPQLDFTSLPDFIFTSSSLHFDYKEEAPLRYRCCWIFPTVRNLVRSPESYKFIQKILQVTVPKAIYFGTNTRYS